MTERRWLLAVMGTLLIVMSVGLFARNLWTPDEPREADLAWRMSGQQLKAVPLLAGDQFCEKPPLTYWAAALPVSVLGFSPWSVRLPNLLYALVTVLAVGLMARRLAGPVAGLAAGAAVGTFLLGYQTMIWLATDAPALAFVSVSLLGLILGFYATGSRERFGGYALMHLALAGAFLSKSALALLVPALTFATLIVLERRWREMLRWELWAGLPLSLGPVLAWVWAVYTGPNGPANLKIFFWNNLAGRLALVDAPPQFQYALAHRNSPGKYLLELPLYLWPWTLLVVAAVWRAWRVRGSASARTPRVALAACVPAVVVLSFAATARNVYLAPALPGFAVLVGWWVSEIARGSDRWDVRALRATSALVIIATLLGTAALTILAFDSPSFAQMKPALMILAAAGMGLALYTAIDAWINAAQTPLAAAASLFFGFCCLLSAPCWLGYAQINRWQDLSVLGARIRTDLDNAPLALLAPDETTRAFVDLYVSSRAAADHGSGTAQPDAATLQRLLQDGRGTAVLVQVDGRSYSSGIQRLSRALGRREPRSVHQELAWAEAAGFRPAHVYALPNGRRYALFEPAVAGPVMAEPTF